MVFDYLEREKTIKKDYYIALRSRNDQFQKEASAVSSGSQIN